jgi:hypothetical protein
VLLMIDKHAVQALGGSKPVQAAIDRAFNETRFATDRQPPCYRHFVVATASPADPLLAWTETAYGAVTRAAAAARAGEGEAAADQMFALLEAHADNQRVQVRLEPQRRTTQVAEAEWHRTKALAALDAMTAEAGRLERLLRDVEQSPAFRFTSWARRLAGRS